MAKVTVGSYIEHYHILEELGKGGMGVVYKALNVNLEKYVAIKTITLGLSSEKIITNRFRTEARALAKLQNPNIVSIFDFRVDDNQWFIVMEYVDGKTLSQKIRENDSIPWQECLGIFKQILSAIGHAHRAGIIHRDIKPNNIMLTRDGMVKITDFGLAKDQKNLSHTQTSSTGGTLYYMSPEQVKGLHFTDNRSDIYSLGLTLYEMLAGKIPFRKDDSDFAIREAIIKHQFPPPTHFNPSIPVGLNSIVMRSIEKRPEDRFQSIDEMLESMEQFEHAATTDQTKLGSVTENQTFSQINPAEFDISYVTDSVEKEEHPFETAESPVKSKRFRYSFVGVLAIIAAIAVYFIITWLIPAPMAELMVISTPRGARLMVNGENAGQTPVYNFLARSGPINISLEKDSYLPLDTVITLVSDTLNYFACDLVPAGMIDIEISPSNARVWINEHATTIKGNANLKLASGSYDIRVACEGYQTLTDKVFLQHGDSIARIYSLAILTPAGKMSASSAYGVPEEGSEKRTDYPAALRLSNPMVFHSGALSVRSKPEGADIMLDGYRVPGFLSPCILDELAPGAHLLELHKDGYSPYSDSIMITQEETTLVITDLSRMMGDIKVLVKPWGSIYIDQQLVKENTNTAYSGRFGTGQYDLKVVHSTFGVWQKAVEINKNQVTSVVIDFNQFIYVPVTAFDVDGNPVWADIIVDNRQTGDVTPKEVGLRIGLRTVAARKEGYVLVNGEKTVMVSEDLFQPLKFVLRKVESSQAYQP